MPKRKLVAATGQYYHIFNRGALKGLLFYTPAMYHLFLSMIQVFAERFHISIIAVCIMPNHFHLLVYVEEEGRVDEFMRLLCGSYSRRVNFQLKRTGTIYEGRYHIKRVTSDGYFECLCRYIHLNPVKAALVDHPANWDYSNVHEVLGLRRMIHGDHDRIVQHFRSVGRYEKYLLHDVHSTLIKDPDLAKDLAEMRIV